MDPPEWFLRHSQAVAETAAWLALRTASAGSTVDRRLVESAALLHDVDKLPAVRVEVDGLRHGDGTAAWLTGRGFAELGPVVSGHPVTRLADGAWFENWLAAASPEALIVAYADKRAGQRQESMAERFESWKRRYPPETRAGRVRGSWTEQTLAAVWRRAEIVESRVCEAAGVSPDQVKRLPWTLRAMRAASVADTASVSPAAGLPEAGPHDSGGR
jgi:hypothetical protein